MVRERRHSGVDDAAAHYQRDATLSDPLALTADPNLPFLF